MNQFQFPPVGFPQYPLQVPSFFAPWIFPPPSIYFQLPNLIAAVDAKPLVRTLFSKKPEFEDGQAKSETIDPWGLIRKGKATALVAPAGAGKGWLAAYIVKHANVKTCVLALEDFDDSEALRFWASCPDKNDLYVIGADAFDHYVDELKERIASRSDFQISTDFRPIAMQKIEAKAQRFRKALGVDDQTRFSRALALSILIEALVELGYELIVLDNLNAVFPDGIGGVTRETLMPLIRPATSAGTTLVILHHTNKKGEIAGTSEISNALHASYVMSVEKQEDPSTGEAILRIETDKTRSIIHKRLRFKRTRVSVNQADLELLGQFEEEHEPGKNLKDRVLEILRASSTGAALMDDLVTSLECSPTTLKNKLKELEREGRVEKGDGKIWKEVRLLD